MMKKTFIILVSAVLFLSFQAKAQLGVHIGYNFAKVSGIESTGFDEKYLANPSAGLFFEKDLIPLLNIRLGAAYSPKGYHLAVDDFYTKSSVNYLEIPVLAKVKLGPVYALGGVYGAYALNGKTKNHYEVLGILVDEEKDLDFDNEQIKRFDYGMKFGLGVQVGVGPLHVFAQGEYSFGLQNLNDGDGDELKNNVLGVSAGVLIGF